MSTSVTVANTKISVVSGSVLDQDVDVIVNAANTKMRGGKGIDGEIHKRAGSGLFRELVDKAPNGAETAEPILTAGYHLQQGHIIHVAGPVYTDERFIECEKELRDTYNNVLKCADANKFASIAFPSISTGAYRFPLEKAAYIALGCAVVFATNNPDTSVKKIVFAMYRPAENIVFDGVLNRQIDSLRNLGVI